MEEKNKQSEFDYIRDLLLKQQLLLEKRNRLLTNWRNLIDEQNELLTKTPISQENYQHQKIA